MRYSNNYAKYIENLKLEKNKKAFQRLVESTKEIKSEKIVYEEPFASKKPDSIFLEEEPSNKGADNIFVEEEINRKNSNNLESSFPYIEQNEYDSIQKIKEVKFSEKNRNDISVEMISDNPDDLEKIENVEVDSEKENKKLDIQNSNNKKIDKSVEHVDSTSFKPDDFIVYEYSVDNKVNDSVLKEYVLSNKNGLNIKGEESNLEKKVVEVQEEKIVPEKNSVDIKKKEERSKKEDFEIKREEAVSEKSHQKLIDSIKKERKNEKAKLSEYVIAKPRKNENLKAGIYKGIFDLDRAGEEAEYEYNASEYGYYPFGTYSQLRSTQRGALDDAFGRITNASNWSSPGKVIVNSLKVATDIVDMLNLVGPSANIHNNYTANKLRWDLKVDEVNNFEAGSATKSYNELYSYKGKIHDKNGDLEELENDSGDKNSGDNEINLEEKFKANNQDEDGNLANKSGDSNDKSKNEDTRFIKAADPRDIENDIITEFVDPEDVGDKNSGENEIKLEEKFTANNQDEDGNLANSSGDLNSKKRLEHAWDVRSKDPNNSEEVITEFSYSTASSSDSDRWFDKTNSPLGKIYVIPPYLQLSRTNREANNNVDVAFTIPLQNNLQFEQLSRGATWTAIQFFGRIGDVQQYARTGSMDAITLTTEYFVDSDDGEYSMAKLQDIEMKYRSLVLPAEMSANYMYKEDDASSKDRSTYYYFTRPPLINIVLGANSSAKPTISPDDFKQNSVYKNLFTDIITTYNDKGTMPYSHEIKYKNFVVTNVSIDKSSSNYNYYIDKYDEINKTGDYMDTMGFKVTLTVLEIDGNYLGSMPSFNSYYNTLAFRQASPTATY